MSWSKNKYFPLKFDEVEVYKACVKYLKIVPL